MEKTVSQMFEEKNKRIQEYRSETQLNIQLGQAVNLAVEVMGQEVQAAMTEPESMEKFNGLVDFFMSYLDKKRKQIFNDLERMYQQDPAPTVEKYENMNEVEKKYYKDKQLENNRRAYRERNARRAERIDNARQSAELDINIEE